MPNNNVIDRLSIEFEAEVTRVLSDTSKLLSALTNVANKVRELDGLKVSLGITKGTGEALERFARAVDSMDVNKFREFATATNYMAKINLGLNEKSGDNLLNFAAAVESMDVGKLYDLGVSTSTIQKLPNIIGAKSVENLVALGKAIDGFNVQKFGELSQVNSGFSKIPYLGVGEKTGTNLQHFSTALDSLNLEKMSAWSSVNEAFHPFSNMGIGDKTGKNLQSFSTALNSIDLGKLREFSDVNSAFQSITLGIGAKSGDNLANFALGLNQLDLNKLRELSQIDFTNMKVLSQASQNIRGLAVALNRLEKTSVLADKRQRSLGRSIANTGDHAKRSSNKLLNLFQTIKRIAFYRAIRSAMKAFVSGFAEGIENLYYWSQMVGTSFAPRMDQLATATQYLKNGFASMWSPLIEYAIPIIDNLIDRLVDMFNVVQELFARLTGAATWNKALKYPVTYKDALDDASGSAKALQNILMDFDEINAINTPKSGSRGSGADAKDYSSMFQLMKTATGNPMAGFGKFFEDIAEKVETAYGIVNRFWQFFKGLNFAPFKKSLDDLWNNTLSPIIDDLLADADWFREKVLQPITQFLVEEGIPAAIDTIGSAIGNLWKFFEPFKEGLKSFWDQNGEWIMEVLKEHTMLALEKIQDAFKALGDFSRKNGSKVKSLFSSLGSIVSKLSPIIAPIVKAIGTHAWDTFAQSIRDIFTALEPILTLLDGIFKILDGLLSWDKDKMADGFGVVGESILQLMLAPLKLVLGAFATLLDTLAVLVEKVDKDAARSMREFADTIRGTDSAMEALNDDWWEADRVSRVFHENLNARGELLTFIDRINTANSSMNLSVDTIEGLVGSIQQVGPRSKEEFEILQFWSDWCRKYGIDPIAKATDTWSKTNYGNTAGQTLYNGLNAWVNPINALFANMGVTACYSMAEAIRQRWRQENFSFTIPVTAKLENPALNSPLLQPALFHKGFATGGFPSPSTFFYAGEGGVPEMLGTVGGRTAVAGGAEITGIREAILEQGQREEGLLRSLISAVQNKDLSLVANSATGRWVNKALKAYSGVSG